MSARRLQPVALLAALLLAVPCAHAQDKKPAADDVQALKKQIADLNSIIEQERRKAEEAAATARRALRDSEAERKRLEKEALRSCELLETLAKYLAAPAAQQPSLKPTRAEIDESLKVARKFLEAYKTKERFGPPGPRQQQVRELFESGEQLEKLGRLDLAEQAYRKAILAQMMLLVDFPGVTAIRLDAGRAYLRLGALQRKARRYDESEATLRRGLPILEKLAADLPKEADVRAELARACRMLGEVLRDLRRLDDAEPLLRRAAELEKQAKSEAP